MDETGLQLTQTRKSQHRSWSHRTQPAAVCSVAPADARGNQLLDRSRPLDATAFSLPVAKCEPPCSSEMAWNALAMLENFHRMPVAHACCQLQQRGGMTSTCFGWTWPSAWKRRQCTSRCASPGRWSSQNALAHTCGSQHASTHICVCGGMSHPLRLCAAASLLPVCGWGPCRSQACRRQWDERVTAVAGRHKELRRGPHLAAEQEAAGGLRLAVAHRAVVVRAGPPLHGIQIL